MEAYSWGVCGHESEDGGVLWGLGVTFGDFWDVDRLVCPCPCGSGLGIRGRV